MKFKFIGTGNPMTKRRCTSFVVNDSILFEIGHGVFNGLIENNLDVNDIKIIAISHFHPDHFYDIVYFLNRRAMLNLIEKPLTVIGPKGIEQKIIELINVGSIDVRDHSDIAERWNIKFVELDDGKKLVSEGMEITAFKVKHNTGDCNGYVIKSGERAIGYTGDASLTDSIVNRLPEARSWIFDANDVMRREYFHIGFGELIGIAESFKNIIFYAVHRKDYDTGSAPFNLICPGDNDEFIAK